MGIPTSTRFLLIREAEEQRHLHEPVTSRLCTWRLSTGRCRSAIRIFPQALFECLRAARQLARQRWNDPNWSLLLWGKQELEREAELIQRSLAQWSGSQQEEHRDLWPTAMSRIHTSVAHPKSSGRINEPILVRVFAKPRQFEQICRDRVGSKRNMTCSPGKG